MTDSEKEDINQALMTINECLVKVGTRLNELERYVQEIPTPDKTLYKPQGADTYLNVRENYDEIYSRIIKLEEQVDGVQ